ncbi:helix-turn-helix domain-containing protein, partial [Staphylococcus aureus]
KKGGRPSKGKLSIDLALKMYDSKEYSIRQILDASKLSKTTFYRYLNKRNA